MRIFTPVRRPLPFWKLSGCLHLIRYTFELSPALQFIIEFPNITTNQASLTQGSLNNRIMLASTMNPLDQSHTFDDPFSIPASNVSVNHHTFLLSSCGRSAAKAAPASLPAFRAAKSTNVGGIEKHASYLPPCHPRALPPRHAPLQASLSLLEEDSSQRRRLSCSSTDDAPPSNLCRSTRCRWEWIGDAATGLKRRSMSVDRLATAQEEDLTLPPPGQRGCRARYNFHVGLTLVLEELRIRRRGAAADAAALASILASEPLI